jgi:hypothetical protein
MYEDILKLSAAFWLLSCGLQGQTNLTMWSGVLMHIYSFFILSKKRMVV